ncbi:MAG: hypothetical protein WDN31_11460 [Hyphomicrobium sp.]
MVTAWPTRGGEDLAFPFAILPDRDHGSVHEPAVPSGAAQVHSDRLGQLILEALQCATDAQYRKIAEEMGSHHRGDRSPRPRRLRL